MKNRSTVLLSGALAGGLIAIALLALFAGRYATEAIGLSDGGDPEIAVSSGALYLAVVIISLLGGLVVSVVAYGASAEGDDEGTRFELTHIVPFGLVTAVASGYSIVRAGVGLTAEAEAGVTTINAGALALTALVSGIVTGALVAWVVATLAAKSVVGFEGEAAPASTAAMMRAAARAVTGPMLAGSHRGARVGACTDCRRYWARFRASEIDAEEIAGVNNQLVPTVGTCGVRGTASTMACIAEALGMTLPGSATAPAARGYLGSVIFRSSTSRSG